MKMFKMLLLVMLFAASTTTYVSAAQKDIKVIVSGKEVVFEDQQPIIQDGRTLVPIHGIFEMLEGANGNTDAPFAVSWDEKTSTATIKNKWYTVTIKSGENSFTSNGKTITPDVAPQIINGRFMLPLRAVSEAVDAKADWDGKNSIVEIYYETQVIETQVK